METMRRQYKITLAEEDSLAKIIVKKMKALAEVRMEERIRGELGRVISTQMVVPSDNLDFRYTISVDVGAILSELGEIRRTSNKKGKKK